MVKLEHDVAVERPVAEVFAYLSDPANVPAWQSGVVEARKEFEGPSVAGSRWREVRKFLGRRLESTVEVTEHEPDRAFSLRVVSGPVPFEVRHTLEPTNGGTRIKLVGQGEPGGFFKLAEPLVARQAKRTFEHDFATLRDILEARS